MYATVLYLLLGPTASVGPKEWGVQLYWPHVGGRQRHMGSRETAGLSSFGPVSVLHVDPDFLK